MALEPLADKWQAFGWRVDEVDGDDVAALVEKLRAARQREDQPTILIAHTVKGKGVSFVEQDFTWHGRAITKPEQVEKAREELHAARG